MPESTLVPARVKGKAGSPRVAAVSSPGRRRRLRV